MSHRASMVAGELRKLVAQFALEIPPDVCVFPSITEVEISPDIAYATVYVSALENTDAAVKFLANEKAELRRRMSKMSSGYKLPELRFVADTRSERGNRIEQILAASSVAEPRKPAKRGTPKKKRKA